MADTVTKLVARIGDKDGREISLKGRPAWAAAELFKAGPAGCTPITHPGPRWSAYVHKLRGFGLAIETIHESHRGDFPGHYARYVPHTPLVVVEEVRA